MLRVLLHNALAATPGRCEVCHAWPARTICDACVARFAQPVPRCGRCAHPVPAGVAQCAACLREPSPLASCHAALSYDFPWSSLIRRYKFLGQPGFADSFAALMRSAPWIEPTLDSAELVLPMPLAPGRLSTRGFNQSLELARRIAPQLTQQQLLLRVRETAPQTALDRAGRRANVMKAFAVNPLHTSKVRGRRLVLVDDVMTSGASLYSAAHELLRAGASSVSAVVLARAGEMI